MRVPDGIEHGDYVLALESLSPVGIAVYSVTRSRHLSRCFKSKDVRKAIAGMEEHAHDEGSFGSAVFLQTVNGFTQIGNMVNARYRESG